MRRDFLLDGIRVAVTHSWAGSIEHRFEDKPLTRHTETDTEHKTESPLFYTTLARDAKGNFMFVNLFHGTIEDCGRRAGTQKICYSWHYKETVTCCLMFSFFILKRKGWIFKSWEIGVFLKSVLCPPWWKKFLLISPQFAWYVKSSYRVFPTACLIDVILHFSSPELL